MRIVNVIIVTIMGIMLTITGGYIAHATINAFYVTTNSTIRGDLSGDALTTLDYIYDYTGNIGLYWTILTVIGLIIWFLMSTQDKEKYTGVYYE